MDYGPSKYCVIRSSLTRMSRMTNDYYPSVMPLIMTNADNLRPLEHPVIR